MNAENTPPDPAPDEPTGGPVPDENQDKPKKKARRHLFGLPPGYKFDPNFKPIMADLYGTPACFGDEEMLLPGESRTESDGLSVEL